MEINKREADKLNGILCQIREKAGRQDLPKYTIENLCDKAKVILKKADRRSQRITKLHFEENDFII